MRSEYEVLCRSLQLPELSDDLLDQALTHSSAVNELKLPLRHCNERLEHLGDAVVGLCVSASLFQIFPDAPEGELSKMRSALVCEESLADLARELELGLLLKMGRGERQSGGAHKQAILADAMEALFGAIFLAYGYQEVQRVVNTLLVERADLSRPPEQSAHQWKSKLQELAQRSGPCEIVYHCNQTGSDHNPLFSAEVVVNGRKLGTGQGGTKKEAEQAAARVALRVLQGA